MSTQSPSIPFAIRDRICAPAKPLVWTPDDFADLGPRTAWFRLKVPVIAGEEPTPLQRLLVAADFPNGISNELDWREWLYINPDLTVYIERDPRSEWVALQAHTRMLEGETALAQAVLFDTEGRIGRSLIDKAGGQVLVSAASDSLRLCWRGLLETT